MGKAYSRITLAQLFLCQVRAATHTHTHRHTQVPEKGAILIAQPYCAPTIPSPIALVPAPSIAKPLKGFLPPRTTPALYQDMHTFEYEYTFIHVNIHIYIYTYLHADYGGENVCINLHKYILWIYVFRYLGCKTMQNDANPFQKLLKSCTRIKYRS